MVQTLQASKVDSATLSDNFKLEVVRDLSFFPEWQEDLPEITEIERQFLDKIQEGFFNLSQHSPLLEKAIQIVVLSPMFFLADFYLSPFQLHTEKSVQIITEDEDTVIRGEIDVLLLKENFWLLVVESKEEKYSFRAGRSQILSYMLANPKTDKPCFGLIVGGGNFVFLKLVKGVVNQYAISRVFDIENPGNELYDVYRIMKRIAAIA